MFRRLVVSQAADGYECAGESVQQRFDFKLSRNLFFFQPDSAPNEIYYSITLNLLSDTLSNVIDLDGFYFNEYSLVHASCLRVHLDSL